MKPTKTWAEAHRVSLRWAIGILLVALACDYLLPRAGELDNAWQSLKGAHMGWVAAAVGASMLTYLASTVTVLASTPRRLPWVRTGILLLAATILNRITPKGVGSIAMTEQYLEKRGMDRAEATAAVTLVYGTGIVAHILMLGVAALVVRPDYIAFELVGRHTAALAGAIGVLALASLVLVPYYKEPLGRWLAEVRAGLKYESAHPLKFLMLFAGAVGITLCYAMALYFSMLAVGATVGLGTVLFVYLAGSAVAAASPTPGGLGAAEAALALGLAATGVPIAHAVAGVLIFRLASFWFPILPGLLALRAAIRGKLV
jgi:undecaprenyl-diphosphatase